jgi:4'-phosphopantetheinyl transferase
MSRHCIQLWSWHLDEDAPTAGSLLSDDERARAGGFVGPLLQRRFVVARSRLRALLGRHVGCDPRRLVFVLNEHGKPRLADHPGVHFSLSHSQDRALLAVSDGPEIGADLEMVRPVDHLDLSRRYFHPDEVAAIERQEDPRLAFFRIWTLKEAVVKAIGLGLSLPLDSFAVSIAGPRPVMAVAPAESPGPWWLHAEPGDYCRALAAPVGGEIGLIHRNV